MCRDLKFQGWLLLAARGVSKYVYTMTYQVCICSQQQNFFAVLSLVLLTNNPKAIFKPTKHVVLSQLSSGKIQPLLTAILKMGERAQQLEI